MSATTLRLYADEAVAERDASPFADEADGPAVFRFETAGRSFRVDGVHRGFAGTNFAGTDAADEEEPDVIPLAGILTLPAGKSAPPPVTRARALHRNRTCKSCGCAGVEPVVLGDGRRDGGGDLIPGTATLVGFHCDRCGSEWPV